MDQLTGETQQPLLWRYSPVLASGSWPDPIPQNTLVIPFFVSLIIGSLRVLHLASKWMKQLRQNRSPDNQSRQNAGFLHEIYAQTEKHGGRTILGFSIARLIGCLTLFALSVSTIWRIQKIEMPPSSALLEVPEVYMALTYLYCSTLAFSAVFANPESSFARRAATLILLVVAVVYGYRDIWSLATYTRTPEDASEGAMLWAKITILSATSLLIPLFVPTYYIPVDPANPSPIPNPEQTCSLISFLTYSYISPVVQEGSRAEHIDVEKLPPVCDTDVSFYLREKAFPHLDALGLAKPRHLFFRLLRLFGKEVITMLVSSLVATCFAFLAPISIYHILIYLENDGAGENLRPWFWILCLLLGPTLSCIFNQCFQWIGARIMTHQSTLLTQLVFEHSLRIRYTAEDTEEGQAATPEDNVSVTEDPQVDTEHSSDSGEATSSQTTVAAQASPKGKDKDDSLSNNQQAAPKSFKGVNLTGKLNNLVTTDLGNINLVAGVVLVQCTIMPIKIALCALFLYRMLGWSSLIGLASMIILLPAPGYAAKLTQDVEERKMGMTDARIQVVTEAISVLRMIKLFGWEDQTAQKIKDAREKELQSVWRLKVLGSLTAIVDSLIPTINMLVTYLTYTILMKQELTPSVIFSSLTVFDSVRLEIGRASWYVSRTIAAKVSLDRINNFLEDTELIDSYIKKEPNAAIDNPPTDCADYIGFRNATFSWSLGALTNTRSYRLRVDGDLFFKPGCINLIIGPTGGGKTSLLMALLGEMHFIPKGPDSWFHLPREGGVAYAAQESWVQNETIKSNILFGSPYDDVRYRKVLDQCALNQDLDLFEAGDETEVGERGITLSGGQKARLTLARAIYSPAKILLLDDVFAALDVHTSTTIVEKCFKGDLIKGRTILLVTHNISLLSPIAQYIVSIGQEGKITSRGNDIQAALDSDILLANEAARELEEQEIANQEISSVEEKKENASSGKLVLSEEVEKGRVTWKSVSLFLSALGGRHRILFFSLWTLAVMSESFMFVVQKWFLGYWGSQYENHAPSEVSVSYYASIYSGIVLLAILVSTLSNLFYVLGSMRASRSINGMLVNSVLHSTLRWLDETPTSRIISRFTSDIGTVDGSISQNLSIIATISMDFLILISVVFIFAPLFVVPGVAIVAVAMLLGNHYLKAQLSITRENSNALAPILAHFGAAVGGIVSIRAYGYEDYFKNESLARSNKRTPISRTASNLNRWIGVRIDLLGASLVSAMACYLVYGRSIGASNTGFSLNTTTEFCSVVLLAVRVVNGFEVSSNSLERIQNYLDIDHEPKSSELGRPPAAWPTSGDLRVEKLSARYSKNGPKVLHDLSFHIESGQRIGIVGRTGSGKSSLTLALLRCIITEGTVYYDGIPTNQINLDALRSNITIIPQTPELMSGTLRQNLDPFNQHDDAALNEALRSAGLFSLQDELGEARLNLDSNVTSSGTNMSVGERQILALARAMLRGSKVLILDEATSAVDYKTDALIQNTLRHKLDPGVTVITVAHRLQTIMDADKIMVLAEGRIAEFDTPQALLSEETGLFRSLVDSSGDKEALYDMAGSRK